MIKTIRYKYDGHDIMLRTGSKNEAASIGIDKAYIYVDGKEYKVQTEGSMSKGHVLLGNGDKIDVTIRTHLFSESRNAYDVSINGQSIQPVEQSQTPKRSLENLKILASAYSSILGNISVENFLTIKEATANNVHKLSPYKDTAFYLYIGNGPMQKNDVVNNRRFIPIEIQDIKKGDSVAIVQTPLFSSKNDDPIFIENVSIANSQRSSQFGEFSYAILEGDGHIYHTRDAFKMDINEEKKKLTKALEQLGWTVDKLSSLVPPAATLDEFMCIKHIHEHGILINDKVLQDIVDGKSLDEIVTQYPTWSDAIEYVQKNGVEITSQVMADMTNGKSLDDIVQKQSQSTEEREI